MKHVFRFFLFLGIPLLCAMGCSSSFDANPDGTYHVRIPVNDSHGQYHLETVALKSVTNISSLASSTVNIRVNGEMFDEKKQDGSGSIWVKNFGTVPAAHFIKSGDVLIPTDYRTLVMASLVYQFESIRDFYERYKGNAGLRFPRTILLDISYKNLNGKAVFMEHNDMKYLNGLDIFVVQPYDEGLLPLPINGGIAAHEYFHGILDGRNNEKQKGKVRAEMKPEIKGLLCANFYQYGGLNEGIADFFGYAYSHDSNYGSTSMESEKNTGRDLREPKALYVDEGDCRTNVHVLGVVVAHLLYVISEEWGVDETSKATFNFLNFYVDLFTTDYDKNFIGLKRILPFLFENHRPSVGLCEKMKKVVLIPDVFSGYCPASAGSTKSISEGPFGDQKK